MSKENSSVGEHHLERELDTLTPKQRRKLKSIAKALDDLLEDVQQTWPEASIASLDSGGLSVFDNSFVNGINYGDMKQLGSAYCKISGGSY